MKSIAKKTFSSGRDTSGKLILFEEGKSYDLSSLEKSKRKAIDRNFEHIEEPEIEKPKEQKKAAAEKAAAEKAAAEKAAAEKAAAEKAKQNKK